MISWGLALKPSTRPRVAGDRSGLPVDTSGQIYATDVPGIFNGPVELGAKLAASDQAVTCAPRSGSALPLAATLEIPPAINARRRNCTML